MIACGVDTKPEGTLLKRYRHFAVLAARGCNSNFDIVAEYRQKLYETLNGKHPRLAAHEA